MDIDYEDDFEEEPVLADEYAEGDEPCVCYVGICMKPGLIMVGPGGDLDICPDHAVQMVLELLALKPVQEALLKQQKAVIILDDTDGHSELQLFELLLWDAEPKAPDIQQLQDRLLDQAMDYTFWMDAIRFNR